MVEFTLLEIHLDDAIVDAHADPLTALPFSSIITDDKDDEDADASENAPAEIEIDEDEESTVSLKPLVLLVAVVILAVVAKKLLAGDEE